MYYQGGRAMKQLLLLEMKKNNFKQIVMGGLLTSGILLIYLIMSGVLMEGSYKDYTSYFSNVIAYNKIVFTIFAGLLIIRMFSEEINSKSISILFTYPLSRKRLLVVKVILVISVTMPLMFLSMLLHFIVLAILNLALGFAQGSMSISFFVSYIVASLLHSAFASLAALIPLLCDVKWISSQKTLIGSAVLAIFLYSIKGSSLFGIALILVVLAAGLGILLTRRAIAVVVDMDIM